MLNVLYYCIRKSGPWAWGLQLESDKDQEEEAADHILDMLADKRLSRLANQVDIFFPSSCL